MMKLVLITLILYTFIIGCDNNYPISETQPFNILYISDSDTTTEIYMMDSNGKNKFNISNHPSNDGGSQFSPDGKYIYFVSERDSNISSIYKVKRNNSHIFKLTKGIGLAGNFCLSKDGSKIIFLVNEKTKDNPLINSMFIMDSNGQNLMRLTSDWNCENPSFSPNGKRIAFDGWRNGFNNIFIMDIDGNNLKDLTNDYGYLNHNPIFSQNGSKIYFNSFVEGNYNIHQIDLISEKISKINNDYAFIATAAQIASNDSLIVYTINDITVLNKILLLINDIFKRKIFDISYELDICLFNPYTNKKILAGQIPMKSRIRYTPFFSPDAKKIVLTLNIINYPTSERFAGDIFLFDICSSQYWNLTNDNKTNNWIEDIY